jgi:hypothetical protein
MEECEYFNKYWQCNFNASIPQHKTEVGCNVPALVIRVSLLVSYEQHTSIRGSGINLCTAGRLSKD